MARVVNLFDRLCSHVPSENSATWSSYMQCWLGNVHFQYFQKSNRLVTKLHYVSYRDSESLHCRVANELRFEKWAGVLQVINLMEVLGLEINSWAKIQKEHGMSRDQYSLHKYFLGPYHASVPLLSTVLILGILFKVDVLARVPPRQILEWKYCI